MSYHPNSNTNHTNAYRSPLGNNDTHAHTHTAFYLKKKKEKKEDAALWKTCIHKQALSVSYTHTKHTLLSKIKLSKYCPSALSACPRVYHDERCLPSWRPSLATWGSVQSSERLRPGVPPALWEGTSSGGNHHCLLFQPSGNLFISGCNELTALPCLLYKWTSAHTHTHRCGVGIYTHQQALERQ